MDRLTQYTNKGASLILDDPQTDAEAREQLTHKFRLACDRLAAYEDTGLTPSEVVGLAQSKAEIIKAVTCESCDCHICEAHKECVRLRAELEQVKAERDAAVQDVGRYIRLPHTCAYGQTCEKVKADHRECMDCLYWAYKRLGVKVDG